MAAQQHLINRRGRTPEKPPPRSFRPSSTASRSTPPPAATSGTTMTGNIDSRRRHAVVDGWTLWQPSSRRQSQAYARVPPLIASPPPLRTGTVDRPPPVPGREPATGTPGARKTSRRSCRIARRFAEGSVIVFARPGPHSALGGPVPAKDVRRWPLTRRWSVSPPIPRRGNSPSPFPFPLPSGRGQRGVAVGERRAGQPLSPLVSAPRRDHGIPGSSVTVSTAS